MLNRVLWVTSILSFIAVITVPLNAQTSEIPRRWSLDLYGGINRPFFNVTGDMARTYGGSIRYSSNPLLTVKGSVYRGIFRGTAQNYFGRDFENEFMYITLQPEINITRALQNSGLFGYGKNTFPDLVDWYAFAGPGVIFNDVTVSLDNPRGLAGQVSGQSYNGYTALLSGGSGLRLRLGGTVDFFVQYEYAFTEGKLLDGYMNNVSSSGANVLQPDNDRFGIATGGLSFKFGSTDKQHVAWQSTREYRQRNMPDYRKAITELKQQLSNSDATIEEIQTRLQQLSKSVNSNNKENENHNMKFGQISTKIESIESQIKQLKSAVKSGNSVKEIFSSGKKGYYIIAGSYIQADGAIQHVKRLRDRGLESAVILSPSYYPNQNLRFHYVSLARFDSKDKANSALTETYRPKYKESAWVLEIK